MRRGAARSSRKPFLDNTPLLLAGIVALIVALAYCWKKGALEWES